MLVCACHAWRPTSSRAQTRNSGAPSHRAPAPPPSPRPRSRPPAPPRSDPPRLPLLPRPPAALPVHTAARPGYPTRPPAQSRPALATTKCANFLRLLILPSFSLILGAPKHCNAPSFPVAPSPPAPTACPLAQPIPHTIRRHRFAKPHHSNNRRPCRVLTYMHHAAAPLLAEMLCALNWCARQPASHTSLRNHMCVQLTPLPTAMHSYHATPLSPLSQHSFSRARDPTTRFQHLLYSPTVVNLPFMRALTSSRTAHSQGIPNWHALSPSLMLQRRPPFLI